MIDWQEKQQTVLYHTNQTSEFQNSILKLAVPYGPVLTRLGQAVSSPPPLITRPKKKSNMFLVLAPVQNWCGDAVFFFFNVNFFFQMYLALYMSQHSVKHLQSSDFPSEVDYN